ncbi:MAG: EAL domain-containing protein [Negativicutes bacterium]
MKTSRKATMPYLVGVLTLIILLLGWIAYAAVNHVAQTAEDIYDHPFTVSTAVLRIQVNIYRMQQTLREVSRVNSLNDAVKIQQQVEELETEIHSAFQLVEGRYLGNPQSVQEALQAFTESREIRREVIRLCFAGQQQEALQVLQESGIPRMMDLENKTNVIRDFAQSKAAAFLSEARADRENAVRWIFGDLSGLMILAGAIFHKAMQLEKNLRKINLNLEVTVQERTRALSDANEHLFAQNEELHAQQEELRVINEEREQLNAKLQDMNRELKTRVEQRTQELSLANSELKQSNQGLMQEIAERVRVEKILRQKEDALRKSNETLSLAAELAHLGSWEYNQATDLFEFGNDFYAVLGTDEAREGRFMTSAVYAGEFVHPDDAWVVAAELKRTRESQKHNYSTQLEHRIIRRDGEERTIVVQMRRLRDTTGKVFKQYGAIQDITDRVKVEEALLQKTDMIRHMAYYDELTNLPNRRYLHERLGEELEKARRYNSQGAVFFIDLDELKLVNDTYGHICGDEIIVASGARIVAEMGEKAFVARSGGDEFVAILPGENDHQQIVDIANRTLQALGRKHEMYGTYFHMTASIGVALYPTDGDTVEEIIKDADNAMYAAKNEGKNHCRFYTADMQAEKYQQMQLTNSLRDAMERGELFLHYQPQIQNSSNAVVGLEALLRWNSAEHGMVSPVRFIPLAEQSDLIYPIGQWVLQETCRFARRLSDQGWGRIRVAINISSKQLIADNFTMIVRQAIHDAGIEPQQLELEVTESILMVSMEDAISKLKELKDLGVNLSLDDFGTGYSSLTYLRKLPVNTVKIDKTFIDMITTDDHVEQIIGTIINMAHILEMTVVAEGVETEPQLTRLTRHGCDRVQGYLFSCPIPETEVFQFLADHA